MNAMGIRIYGNHDPFFLCIGDMGPIHIQPVGIGIDFDHHFISGTGIDHLFEISGITRRTNN